ncbi:MAG: hypothetical protein ACYDCC_04690 [Actinomycetota bacterium]
MNVVRDPRKVICAFCHNEIIAPASASKKVDDGNGGIIQVHRKPCSFRPIFSAKPRIPAQW